MQRPTLSITKSENATTRLLHNSKMNYEDFKVFKKTKLQNHSDNCSCSTVVERNIN